MAGAHRNKCPHCGANFPIRSSEALSPILKRVWAQCLNLDCGFTASGYFQWEFELSPSAMPNPDIDLPKSKNKNSQNAVALKQ